MENIILKPLNDGEIMVRRDEKGRVISGSILNPSGKPKGTRHLSTLLTECLFKVPQDESLTNNELIIGKVIDMAKKGDIRAIELIWDRIEGKPTIQMVAHTTQFSYSLSEEEKQKLNMLLE
jgi:hypothetical protein